VIYNGKAKALHDVELSTKEIQVGEKVLYSTENGLFPDKQN